MALVIALKVWNLILYKAVTARWSANSGGTAEATAFRPKTAIIGIGMKGFLICNKIRVYKIQYSLYFSNRSRQTCTTVRWPVKPFYLKGGKKR
ncbi:hypothetical protein DFP95_10345 [Cohnella lupini]|uniref:Uncharacterized protein n=1 Tax=Cohnella lupini TaxID=1294267 RepID=A0A3D9IPZ8_9BACL|nr:hypothetical protein DFP95_10345 [Cohnella lupini]